MPTAAPIAPSAMATRQQVLLFTQLADFARVRRRLGETVAAGALASHDALFRECLEQHDGRELGKTDDGFFAAFDRPADAACCALNFQRLLAGLGLAEPLRARAAIHGESPDETANGEREAEESHRRHAIDRTAAMLELAAGNQILISRETFDRTRRELAAAPDGSALLWLDHGRFAPPALDAPIELGEVGIPGFSPLEAPAAAKVEIEDGGALPGWRPAIGASIPDAPGWRLERLLLADEGAESWLARHEGGRGIHRFDFFFSVARVEELRAARERLERWREVSRRSAAVVRLHRARLDEPPIFVECDRRENARSLRELAEKGELETIASEDRLALAVDAAEALAACHDLGLIHGNLDPDRLRIEGGEERPRAVLSGFGEPPGRGGMQAPEIRRGEPHTAAGDLFALGALTYALARGEIVAPEPGGKVSLDDELLRGDVEQCLQTDPARRPASAREFAARQRTLNERREQRNESARAEEHQRREQRTRRRLIAVVMLGSAALTALLALTFVLLRGGNFGGLFPDLQQPEAQPAPSPETQEELARLHAEREELESLLAVAQDEIARRREAADAEKQARQNLEAQLQSVQTELAALREKADGAEPPPQLVQRIEELEAQAIEQRRASEEARAKAADALEQANRLEAELNAARQTLDELREAKTEAEADAENLKRRIAETEQTLTRTREVLNLSREREAAARGASSLLTDVAESLISQTETGEPESVQPALREARKRIDKHFEGDAELRARLLSRFDRALNALAAAKTPEAADQPDDPDAASSGEEETEGEIFFEIHSAKPTKENDEPTTKTQRR